MTWDGGEQFGLEVISQYFGLRRQSEAATALFSRRCDSRTQRASSDSDSRKAELGKAVWRCASHRTPKCLLHQATANA